LPRNYFFSTICCSGLSSSFVSNLWKGGGSTQSELVATDSALIRCPPRLPVAEGNAWLCDRESLGHLPGRMAAPGGRGGDAWAQPLSQRLARPGRTAAEHSASGWDASEVDGPGPAPHWLSAGAEWSLDSLNLESARRGPRERWPGAHSSRCHGHGFPAYQCRPGGRRDGPGPPWPSLRAAARPRSEPAGRRASESGSRVTGSWSRSATCISKVGGAYSAYWK
jgi:hypothetical protein